MKKLLLLTVTVAALSAKAQTSVYHPFPDSNATWCTSFCGMQGNAFSDDTYQLNGKELINGNWYNRMLHYGRGCYGAGMCYCAALNNAGTNTYYIRQDTAQKKVWLYYPSTNSDTIFLDFNLNVGDTIDGRKAYWSQFFTGDIAVVYSIDSVLIGSQYRTRYNYEYNGFPLNSMIEGIGPNHGIFNMPNTGLEYATQLNLFIQNTQIFYPFYSSDTTGVSQVCHSFTEGMEEQNKTWYSLSPNPATNTFTIQLGSEIKNAELEIYNALGKKVYQQKLSQQLTNINLNSPQGIYFVIVTGGIRMFTQKLIMY
jgi:hypothetical protein